MEKIAALLAHGGQIGAGDAEGVSAWRGAKATGDLLLQFRHPNVALGLVVVKRDTRIVEETQHLVGVSAQTSEEIDRSRLFDPSASAFDTHCFGIEPFARGKDRLIPSAIVPQAFPSQRRLPLSSLIGLGLGRAQQLDHLLWPGLPGGLGQKYQFAQMMSVAQRVRTGVVLVRRPAVMHGYACEPRQDPEVIHDRLAAPVVRPIPTKRCGHRRMQPAPPPAHPLAGFIKVRHRRGDHAIQYGEQAPYVC